MNHSPPPTSRVLEEALMNIEKVRKEHEATMVLQQES